MTISAEDICNIKLSNNLSFSLLNVYFYFGNFISHAVITF